MAIAVTLIMGGLIMLEILWAVCYIENKYDKEIAEAKERYFNGR